MNHALCADKFVYYNAFRETSMPEHFAGNTHFYEIYLLEMGRKLV